MTHEAAKGQHSAGWFMLVPGGLSWLIVTYYHFLRRNVTNPFGAHDLDPIFLANKGMAITAALMIAVAVSIGPLAHWLAGYRSWAGSRREIGLAGFGWVVIHVLTSLTLLGGRFPASWYVEHPLVLLGGSVALALLILIAALSNRDAMRWMGGRRWKRTQRLVHVALAFVVLHYAATGKPANWLAWIEGRAAVQTPLPPGTFLLTLMLVTLLGIRISVWLPFRTHAKQW